MVTGSGPQAKVITPPAATAATTAAEVQLAAEPSPITLVGWLVSAACASAGTAARPAGLPAWNAGGAAGGGGLLAGGGVDVGGAALTGVASERADALAGSPAAGTATPPVVVPQPARRVATATATVAVTVHIHRVRMAQHPIAAAAPGDRCVDRQTGPRQDHGHISQIVSEDANGSGLPTGYSTNLRGKDGQTLTLTYGTAGFGGAGLPPTATPPSMQHTGTVVPVWAKGPGGLAVLGTNDHTDLFHTLGG
jgi:hypothetical protein